MAYNQMTATQLRSTVRQITDLDSDDLPDGLLNLYIRDGYYRILDLEKRWTFLETSFNFSTVANVRAYPISGFTVDPISEVVSIVDNTKSGFRLDMVGYDMAEQTYSGAYDTSGEPLFYAVWNGNINIYPKPNNSRSLTCRGYREPIDWITNNNNVDAPASLHFPLVYYAVARVYQQMEDTTMATIYKQSFDEGVALARKKLTQPTSHGQLIMAHGQTRNRPTMQSWLKSLGSTLGQ